MEQKNILIIIAIAIVLVVVGILVATNFHINEEIEYESLKLSDTCTVSVPKTNNSTFTEDDGIKTYNSTDLKIITYNTNDLGKWENLGADIGVNQVLNQNFKYNHSHHGKSIFIHPDDNETLFACLISNNTTGDVIIAMSANEDILYHVIDNVNFTMNNTNISENTTAETVKTTEDNVKTTDDSDKSTDDDSAGKNEKDESEYTEGYIAENDVDIDRDGDGVGDGSAYHSHEYYVERGQTEPVPLGGGDD